MIRRIQLLNYFLAVARAGGIRQAADSVHLSQPALTRRIQDLEGDLGVALFERTARGMVLTPFGEVLLHHAKSIDLSCELAVQEMHDLANGESGTLRIGAGPAWAFSLVPDSVSLLRKALPQVRIQFYDWITERMLPMLLDGELDILVGGIPPTNQQLPQLTYEPLFDVEQFVFAGQGHPLQGRRCTPKELASYPWIWFREAALGKGLLQEQFEAAGIPWPASSVDSTSIQFGLRLLSQGDSHLMLLPSTLAETARGFDARALRLKQPLPAYPAGMIFRAPTMRLRAASLFRDLLSQRVALLRTALQRRR